MSAEPIPDVMVELLALGELDEPEASELRESLIRTGDPRLETIERSNAVILAEYPPEEVVPGLLAALDPSPAVIRWPRWGLAAGAALVSLAAGIALVWALASGDDPLPTSAPPERVAVATDALGPAGIRHKGEARLLVHRRGEIDPLRDDQEVKAGDLLQLSYVADRWRYGTIVSVDGAGGVTLHWPSTESGDTTLDRGTVRLDYAFELDDAPGFERFFLVVAEQPIEVSAVLDAARDLAGSAEVQGAPLALTHPAQQISLRLRKTGVGSD